MQDITCDSDGRLDLYVDGEGIDSTLPLHPLRENEPYLLGIFLVGAYQEILGDMHNLFGDTDSIHVELKPDGGHQLSQPKQGDTVDSVLRYVHFNADDLLASYRAKIERATSISAKNRDTYLAELSEGIPHQRNMNRHPSRIPLHSIWATISCDRLTLSTGPKNGCH